MKDSSHLSVSLYWTRKNLEHYQSLADEQSPKVTFFHLLDIFLNMDFILPFSHCFFASFFSLFSLFVICCSFSILKNLKVNFVGSVEVLN